MRHLGKNKHTESRYAVISMSLPEAPEYCLVVEYDTLPIRYQDALLNVLRSPEGQAETKLLNLLARRRFPDGDLMHSALFAMNRMIKLHTSDVIMTPDRTNSINLQELNERLVKQTQEDSAAVTEELQTIERTSHIQHNIAVDSSEDSKRRASRLMFEAQLIREQAEADITDRLEQAYKLDPSLRPKVEQIARAETPEPKPVRRTAKAKTRSKKTESAA